MREVPQQAPPGLSLRFGLFVLRPFVRELRGRPAAEILAKGVSSGPLRAAALSVLFLLVAEIQSVISITLRNHLWFNVAVFVAFLASLVLFWAYFSLRTALLAQAAATQKVLVDTVVLQNVEALQKQREQIEESLFERNLKDTFHLHSLSWEGTTLFEDGSYQFAPRVNVLLGKNGYGKTLLFRTLAALIRRDAAVSTHLLASGEGRLRLELSVRAYPSS